jgi:hypothetical protein
MFRKMVDRLVESDWFWNLDPNKLQSISVDQVQIGDCILVERREFEVTGIEVVSYGKQLHLKFTGNGANSAGITSLATMPGAEVTLTRRR